MIVWLFIFLLSCFIIFYNYIGYALLILPINYFKIQKIPGHHIAEKSFFPTISFIVPAFNEEDCIKEKIINSLGQLYPSDKIEFIFITDGSSDNTPAIISQFPAIKLLHNPERRGKSAALNRAVAFAKNEILIFSDTNTTLNAEATHKIVQHYITSNVGGVAGEKKVRSKTNSSPLEGEGIYWRYESFLKKTDSDFYSVVGAAGELFSVRKELFEKVPDNIILDDFYISLKIAEKGYRIIYEPNAVATELPSFSLGDELKRKIRIAAGGFQAIWLLRSLLKWWKHPKLSYLFISHRLLRWAATPFCLIFLIVSNIFLVLGSANILFTSLLILQSVFYLMAIAGSIVSKHNKNIKIIKFAHYFAFMNFAVILGFLGISVGQQSSSWEKVKREQTIDS